MTGDKPEYGDRFGGCRNPQMVGISERNPVNKSNPNPLLHFGPRSADETKPTPLTLDDDGSWKRHLEVVGFKPVEELADEVSEDTEGDEEDVAEERGERSQVRQPHHPPDLPRDGDRGDSGQRWEEEPQRHASC